MGKQVLCIPGYREKKTFLSVPQAFRLGASPPTALIHFKNGQGKEENPAGGQPLRQNQPLFPLQTMLFRIPQYIPAPIMIQ